MDRRRRLALGIALSLVVLGLCVHYGATYDDAWPHPTGDQLAESQDKYVGERVLLFGDVQSVHEDSITIHVTDDHGDVAAALEVRNVDTDDIEPGGFVQVYGVFESEETDAHDGTMRADEIVVVNSSPNAATYKHVVSALGGLFAAGFFLRHWRIDLRRLRFEPRAGSGSYGTDTHPASGAVTDDTAAGNEKPNEPRDNDSEVNGRG
ncbi:hypothetical protein HALLA_08715 [Halostagnicola larsenii XH-48]|uniref:Uncharacterized protein n=1 Tax=Halostagnicola larsenii XH-48 TaxID=797299 RepID=W0JK06_9EURY|nr:DNA-binding protein [Halostagnicola larsenii]AHF98933.1 hypothetical protein HALLA_08715 [Halostagnicola larsenii XH-48]